MDNVFEEGHSPCMLKTSFVDSGKYKHCSRYKSKYFVPTQLSIFFSSTEKTWTNWSIIPSLLYRFFVYCWTCSAPEYSLNTAWCMLSNNQSINQLPYDCLQGNYVSSTSETDLGSSWSYGSLIYNYLYNQCLSLIMLWVWIPLRRDVLDTTVCD